MLEWGLGTLGWGHRTTGPLLWRCLRRYSGFALYYMSLVSRCLGLQDTDCAHLRDGSGLALASMLAWNTSQAVLFQIRLHCWSRSAVQSQSVFYYCISCSGRSCFLSAECFSLRKVCLLGVKLQEFAVLLCSCDKALGFSYEINHWISTVRVCDELHHCAGNKKTQWR